ncbi:MAG: zinc ribbon domain-containing protein [Methanobrevibacter sp.]|nr:zinc ribbon domain-containing protein [Methanobrevibacter sp.]
MIKMTLENYCRICGHRILPNEPYCTGCGHKTKYDAKDQDYVFTPPIHNIGFFNFEIDFSPFIESKNNFKYDICACGYLNDINNEYCYMCGTKRSQSRFSKIFRGNTKPKFSMDNVLCECGTLNPKENVYCEMCGKQLKDDEIPLGNYSNFNLEFTDSVFCFCGEENEKFSIFCRKCGLPLKSYGNLGQMAILCTCSALNEVTSDFCIECGNNLKRQDTKIICICGHKNPKHLKFCESCERPLNPQRNVKTRIVCSCGEILTWDSEYCPNCGKNVKRRIIHKNSINNTVKTLKGMFR